MPMDATFDARQFAPSQSVGGHPVGNKFLFTITNTEVKETKNKDGKYFEVEFTSSSGSIKHNYNLWNNSKQAQDISLGQLSALCHAVGIFNVDFKNDGAALRGAKGLMDIGHQKGQEPSVEKPTGGYVELKKVYDINGNEPGKITPQPQPQTTGFGATTNTMPPTNSAQQPAWGQAQTQPQATGRGWQQGAISETPPWKS